MKRKVENDAGRLIKADLCSRQNAINGKYRACQLGLNVSELVRENDIFFLETLKMTADIADELIEKAEKEGKDTKNSEVLKEIEREIELIGKPVHKIEVILSAIYISFLLMIFYGIALGIWGLAFKKGFLGFSFYGLIAGFLISLLSAAPVIASQRTQKRINDMTSAISMTWGSIGIIIGIAGLVACVIRLVFIK